MSQHGEVTFEVQSPNYGSQIILSRFKFAVSVFAFPSLGLMTWTVELLLTVFLWCLSAGGGATWQISGLLWHRPGEGRNSGSAQRHPPEGSITPPSWFPPPLLPSARSSVGPLRLSNTTLNLFVAGPERSLSNPSTCSGSPPCKNLFFKRRFTSPEWTVFKVHTAAAACLWCVFVPLNSFWCCFMIKRITKSEIKRKHQLSLHLYHLHLIVNIVIHRIIFDMVIFLNHKTGAHRRRWTQCFWWSYPSMPQFLWSCDFSCLEHETEPLLSHVKQAALELLQVMEVMKFIKDLFENVIPR